MKILLKIFVLMLAFSVEIHVKAQTLAVSPECRISEVGVRLDCAALNGMIPTEKKFGSLQLFLQPHAVFSLDQTTLKWVRGSGAVRTQSPIEIKTSFGSALCEKDCLAAFEKKRDHLAFHALKGEWQVLSFAAKDRTPLVAGESVNLYLIGPNGTSDWGIPFSLSKKGLQTLMSKTFLGKLSEQESAQIEESWKAAVEKLSLRYQDQAQRQVADHNEKLRRQKLAREKRAREERALRRLFRKKNLLD